MAVTNYLTMNGMIVHENRDGVQRDYIPDTLGSTAALVDDTQTITDSWEYYPYGEVSQRTGSNPTPFTFVGTLGYFKDVLDKLFYVRARSYQPNLGRWSSVDARWPGADPYTFREDSPCWLGDAPAGYVEERMPTWSPPRVSFKQGGPYCEVLVCENVGINFHHRFICVNGPSGGCSGGLSVGGSDKDSFGNMCRNLGAGSSCYRISTDCSYASEMCKCLHKPAGNWYPWRTCIGYKDEMKCCACAGYKRKEQRNNCLFEQGCYPMALLAVKKK